jgi:hypothetical protein
MTGIRSSKDIGEARIFRIRLDDGMFIGGMNSWKTQERRNVKSRCAWVMVNIAKAV